MAFLFLEVGLMKVAVLVHAPYERLGNIQQWLDKQSAEVLEVNLYEESFVYPELSSLDLLIVLGGPMSVNEEDDYPWLIAEKQYIADAIAAKTPVLGICLGGQLIAAALGAKVTLNDETEIGWHKLQRVPSTAEVFQFPDEIEVFNWHGETFELPRGAVRLLQSEVCANQAYQLGANVIGLQCHPEVTTKEVQEWVDEIGEQMIEGAYVHTPDRMLAETDEKSETIKPVLFSLLDYLTRR